MKLSTAIKDARARRKLTQAQLAALARLPRFVISLIETGRLAEPFPSQVARLCDALGLDPAALEAGGDDAGE